MTPPTKLPTGRLGRLARLASVGANAGASLVVSKDGARAAKQAARVLGNMRGLAAKLGQMASYVDGFVPEKHRGAYEEALGRLRAAAPKSSPAEIRALVETDLGAPVSELFREWEDEPFASASIGQVHRASLADGSEVAVKVQHPGIDRAIESDLKNAGVIERIAGTAMSHMNSRQVFEEISTRFREELDYQLEAERQELFAEIHAGDETIRIPRVIGDRSSRRVLTSEFARGKTLEQVAAEASEPARRAYAETLWRFVFKGTLVGKHFNADPHPGNYLFREDGSIVFLDFGCVQPVPERNRIAARRAHRAACDGDEERFRAAVIEMLRTRGGAYEDAAVRYVRQCFAPLFDSPFRITRGYVEGLFTSATEMKQTILRNRDDSFVGFPEGMALMNRLQFGFYSVVARLDAEADFAAVERRFLES